MCIFLRWQRGIRIPSSAAFGRIGERYVKDIERFAKQNDIPMVHFKKGESKEKRAPLLEKAAQERGNGRGRSGRCLAYVNHYYFYLWDPEWGPAFWKTNGYAPFPIWLCEVADGEARRCRRGAGQRGPLLRRSCVSAEALRSARSLRREVRDNEVLTLHLV